VIITIDGSEIRAFADQLRDAPAELRTTLRREIRAEGKDVEGDIKANASWSSRIPGAVRTTVGFGARSSGVVIRVDAGKAPHARPLEFGNKPGFNRHPVFTYDVWVDQPIRPFFFRAVTPAMPRLVGRVQGVIDDVFARL
jgi:hypothetical protein